MRQNDERKSIFTLSLGLEICTSGHRKKCVTILRIKLGFINSISESYYEIETSKNLLHSTQIEFIIFKREKISIYSLM